MAKCKNCVNLVYDWCDMAADSPDPDMERECHWFAHATNYDRVMSQRSLQSGSGGCLNMSKDIQIRVAPCSTG